MKIILLLCFALDVLLASGKNYSLAESKWRQAVSGITIKGEQISREWGKATYRGIVVGTSSRSDIRRIFGKPKRISVPADQGKDAHDLELWYEFDSSEEMLGRFTVNIAVGKKSGKVISLWLSPENLTKTEAIKYYGVGYVTTRYTFCEGFEGDAAPIYEAEDGQLLYLEYRSRGIALKVNYLDKVDEIAYVSRPIGHGSRNSCKWERKK